MTILEEYADLTRRTSVYPISRELEYLSLGLAGEAGEIANKVKKIIRGDPHNPDDKEIALEIGDLLWYADRLCSCLGTSMENVIRSNMTKLEGRMKRGTIKGNGDGR